MNQVMERGNEVHSIRKSTIEYENIVAGCCNTMVVKGLGMNIGDQIRFVEINTAGRKTGREVFCNIERIYDNERARRQLVKYRKEKESNVYSEKQAGSIKRKKIKRIES